MSSDNRKRANVWIDIDSKDELVKLSKSSKISMKEILGYLIDLARKYQLLNEGWKERLNEAMDIADRERYRNLKDACPALAFTNKSGFVCCRNAPTQKKLGDGSEIDMDAVCSACQRVKGILEEIDFLREKVRRGTTVKIPQCNAGGILQPDGARFWCARGYGRGGYMTASQCEERGCNMLKWTKLDIKGELRRPER